MSNTYTGAVDTGAASTGAIDEYPDVIQAMHDLCSIP